MSTLGMLCVGPYRSRMDGYMQEPREPGGCHFAVASFSLQRPDEPQARGRMLPWREAIFDARPVLFETASGETYEFDDVSVGVETITRVVVIGRARLRPRDV